MNLTEHFTLEELTHSDTALLNGFDNTPNSEELSNLQRVADTMEKVRALLGNKPVRITSGFRSERVNQAVGGVWNSAHRLGLACDFVCPSFGTPKQVAKLLSKHMKELDIDQLIYETAGSAVWVHLGLSTSTPRAQALTYNSAGYTTGIKG